MLLDLREIIGVPGGKVSFDFAPDMTDAAEGSIIRVMQPRAAGVVRNRAGVLTFTATVDALCVCICARCLKEFDYLVHKQITADLTEGGEGENPDGYFLQGDKIDAQEIVCTEFILSMDDNLKCKADCAGLCEDCGSDLNEEPCSCIKKIDPRLAVLGQLLDDV
ncbi:MAG: YceD family protein [Oscillospiraceae bacterium]|nr:YceD family protein [Oscillospiraceae bacterium]